MNRLIENNVYSRYSMSGWRIKSSVQKLNAKNALTSAVSKIKASYQNALASVKAALILPSMQMSLA